MTGRAVVSSTAWHAGTWARRPEADGEVGAGARTVQTPRFPGTSGQEKAEWRLKVNLPQQAGEGLQGLLPPPPVSADKVKVDSFPTTSGAASSTAHVC